MKAPKWSFTRLACLVLLLQGTGWLAEAQTLTPADSSGLKDFLQKIRHAYGSAAYLQFRIQYRYANERQPQQYLDSLSGEVEMDKGRSRTVLDGMETVLNGHYIIQVMPENRVIYLSAGRSAANGSALMQNPVPMLDSLFAHVVGIKAIVEHREGLDILTLNMPVGQPYSTLKMIIDDRTGYFREADYALNTTSLVGEEMIDRPGHPAPYQSRGKIQVLFSDYREGQFDDRLFSEDNFFTHVAGHYESAGRYKGYQIYLTSSNP